MATINTHGIDIKGLKAASGDTWDAGYYSGWYWEIFFSLSTGEVWTVQQYDFGHSWHTIYHDPDIIKISETSMHMTMQQIADAIAETVARRREYSE